MLGLTSFSWPNAQVVHVSPSLGEATRGIKSAHDQERTAAVGWLRRTLRGNAQALAQMEAACAQLAGLYANGTTGRTTVERMRGLIFKQLACSSAAICLGVGSGHVPATIATFPFLHFASGHTYFTQSLQLRAGFVPVAVHTTFQFGDTPGTIRQLPSHHVTASPHACM